MYFISYQCFFKLSFSCLSMVLEFCPSCKNILIPEKLNGKDFWVKCHHCHFSKRFKGKALIEKEKVPKKGKTGNKISKVENEFATYKHKCQKCSFGKAQVIDIGSFYSDEDDLILFKCGKCGWSERSTKKAG